MTKTPVEWPIASFLNIEEFVFKICLGFRASDFGFETCRRKEQSAGLS
jgi:hypothetical protein